MRTRLPVVALIIVILVLPAGVVRAGSNSGNAGDGRYVGSRLDRLGLSLSDDRPLTDLKASPSAFTSSGSSGRGEQEKKNPIVAMLLSCAIPGWGEVYAGETERGRWFMASEVAIWAGYGAFRIQQNMRTDDYEEYAQIFAGASAGASSQYLSDMGDYIRSEGDNSYNEAVRRDARSLYPDDIDAQHAYVLEHGYYGDLAWDWGTRERFLEYRELRSAAGRSERNAFYMTGLAMLNRAISAIDGAWMARRHNAGLADGPRARLSVAPLIEPGDVGARATLEVSF